MRTLPHKSRQSPALRFTRRDSGEPLVRGFPRLFRDSAAGDLQLQFLVSRLQVPVELANLQMGGNPAHNFLSVEWLEDIVDRAGTKATYHQFRLLAGGQKHDRNLPGGWFR